MFDKETLQFRSDVLQKIRSFFTDRSYIELDTPSVSPALLPDTTAEVFKTQYDDPWTDEKKDIYLVPSHEYFLKKAVASLKAPVFQLSKCYRNCESTGRLNSPEFSLLEYYTPGTSYSDSAALTEELIASLPRSAQTDFTPFPFIRLSVDEAFRQYAGFPLSECTSEEKLAQKVREAGIPEFPDNPFDDWAMDELYELILSQCVVPALPKDKGVFLFDCPAFISSSAKDKTADTGKVLWKQQWILYLNGIIIARSRSEETDGHKIRAFMEAESRIKNATARIRHTIDDSFWKTFEDFPECAGTELFADRLIMLLSGKKSIENVIPFPFRLKTGYY